MQLLTPAIREQLRQIVLDAIKRLPPHITPSDPRFLEWLESLIRYHASHPMDPTAEKAPVLGGIGVADQVTPWNLLPTLEQLICGFLSIPVTTEHPTGWGKPFTPENEPLGTPGGTDPDVFLTFGDTDFPAGRLDRSTGYEAGNVDWVDENGGIYTWGGPRSRYFIYSGRIDNSTPWDPTPADSPLEIYYEGALFDTAPVEILGFGRYTYTTDAEEEWATLLIVQAEDVSDLHGVVLHVRAKQYEIAEGPASGSWVDLNTYDTRLDVYPDWKFAAFRWPNSIAPFNHAATEATIVLRDCSYITMEFSDLDSSPSVNFTETMRDHTEPYPRPSYTWTKRETLHVDVDNSAVCNCNCWPPPQGDCPETEHRYKYCTNNYVTLYTPGECDVSSDLDAALPLGGFDGDATDLSEISQVLSEQCAGELRKYPICVDYNPEGERVFAYRYDSADVARLGYSYQYGKTDYDINWTCCPYPQVQSQSSSIDYLNAGKEITFYGTIVVLPWIPEPVCLTGEVTSDEGEATTAVTGDGYVANTDTTRVATSAPGHKTQSSSGKGNIRYLDLRHDLVVYALEDSGPKTFQGVTTQHYSLMPSEPEIFGTRISSTTWFLYSNRLVLRLGDDEIYSGVPHTDLSSSLDEVADGLHINQLPSCGGNNPEDTATNTSGEAGNSAPAQDDFKDFIHWHKLPAAGVSIIEYKMSQWYAVCPAGDVAISQQLFEPAGDPAPIIDESWHYLYRAVRGEQPEAEYDYLEKLEMPDETWPKSTEIKILSITLE